MQFVKANQRIGFMLDFFKKVQPSIAFLSLVSLLALSGPSLARDTLHPIKAAQRFTQHRDPLIEETPYLVGKGDLLQVNIFDSPEYSGEYQVLVDGTLKLPFVDSLSVEGMTLQEISEAISLHYSPLIQNPFVSVTLLSSAPLRIDVIGEVARPGSYVLEVNNQSSANVNLLGTQHPTLTQALQAAEGVTLAADLSRIQIRRFQKFRPENSFEVDLKRFFQQGDWHQNITLRNRDTIFVPTANPPNLSEIYQLASSNIVKADKANRLTVTIIGAVQNPGTFVLAGGFSRSEIQPGGLATVTWAIQRAGGIQLSADLRNIQVRRLTHTGESQIIALNLWKFLQEGDFVQDMALQSGDAIIVPRADKLDPAEVAELASLSFSPATMQIRLAGEFQDPGIVELPLNTTLNQALLATGGFNARARRRSVQLIRLNADGTVLHRKIKPDFTQGINEETNPLLQNHDTIVVDRSPVASIFSDTLRPIFSFGVGLNSLVTVFRNLNLLVIEE